MHENLLSYHSCFFHRFFIIYVQFLHTRAHFYLTACIHKWKPFRQNRGSRHTSRAVSVVFRNFTIFLASLTHVSWILCTWHRILILSLLTAMRKLFAFLGACLCSSTNVLKNAGVPVFSWNIFLLDGYFAGRVHNVFFLFQDECFISSFVMHLHTHFFF